MHNSKAIEPLCASVICPAGRRSETDYVNSFIFWSFVLYMSTLVFEGPLRFALSTAGLGSLIYFRDLLCLICIALGIIRAISIHRNIFDPIIVVLYALLLFGLLGLLIQDVSLFSFAFGLKIYFVLVFGLVAAESVRVRISIFEGVLFFFAISTATGVVLNSIVGKFPWEGLTYETSFGVVSTTKEWWTDGERRLAGFARASYDAAMILGLTAALILPQKKRGFALCIGGVFLASTYLTTSKSMIMAVALLITWLIFSPARYRFIIGQIICVGFLVITIALPSISCIFQFNDNLILEVPRGLSSFAERVVSMWPKSCAILTTPYSWLLGGGIGSIGVPQQYMRSIAYSSADNLFVYLYVSGGAIWGAAFIHVIFRIISEYSSTLFEKSTTVGVVMIIMVYGFTTNMVEQPFFSLIAGLVVAGAWQKKWKI